MTNYLWQKPVDKKLQITRNFFPWKEMQKQKKVTLTRTVIFTLLFSAHNWNKPDIPTINPYMNATWTKKLQFFDFSRTSTCWVDFLSESWFTQVFGDFIPLSPLILETWALDHGFDLIFEVMGWIIWFLISFHYDSDNLVKCDKKPLNVLLRFLPIYFPNFYFAWSRKTHFGIN